MNLISIIIPFKNTPTKWFNKLINSLVKQTNKNFEAIFLDHGSYYSNEYKTIVESNNFRYEYIDENLFWGVGELRDYGVTISQGDYIWFVDSDDWISYDAVNYLLSSFLKHENIDLIMFDYHWVFSEKRVKKIWNVKYDEIVSSNIISKENMKWFHNNYQTDWRVCFKKSFLIENEICHRKNDNIFEDVYYGLIWKTFFNRILLSSRKIYFYNRINENSTLNNNKFKPEYLLKAIFDSKNYLIEKERFSNIWYFYALNWVHAVVQLKNNNDLNMKIKTVKKEFFSNHDNLNRKIIGWNKLLLLTNIAKMRMI